MKEYILLGISFLSFFLSTLTLHSQEKVKDSVKTNNNSINNIKIGILKDSTSNPFIYKELDHHLDSQQNDKSTNSLFNLNRIDGFSLVSEGKVNLYEKSGFVNTSSSLIYRKYYLGKKYQSEPELLKKSSKTFIEICTKYFQDCPELIEKIKNKSLSYRDIKKIVKYYNYECDYFE